MLLMIYAILGLAFFFLPAAEARAGAQPGPGCRHGPRLATGRA